METAIDEQECATVTLDIKELIAAPASLHTTGWGGCAFQNDHARVSWEQILRWNVVELVCATIQPANANVIPIEKMMIALFPNAKYLIRCAWRAQILAAVNV